MLRIFVVVLIFTAIAAAAPAPAPQLEPWRRVQLIGYIHSDQSLDLFGAGEKKLYLETFPEDRYCNNYEQLAFASKQSYREAEKEIGSLVVIDGYVVVRGHESWIVPITMQEKR
tara:strand:- start:281 stop:622 length:342 start_codon:yes stop_codon:yes gene_type:complete